MSDSPMTPGPRPLSYWLDAEHPERPKPSAAMSQQTVLRSMAFRWTSRRIQVISSWTVTAAFAAMTVATSFYGVGVSPGLWGAFAAVCAVIATAYTVHHRVRPVPSPRIFDRSIWVSTTRRGIVAGAVAAPVMLLPAILLLLNGSDDVSRWVTSIVGVSAIVILMGSVMQGWHYEHARRLFRNHIKRNERARAVLEDMSLDPPVSAGTAERFGPL